MQLVNCTPHVLNVIDNFGNVVTLAPSGIVPRVTTSNEAVGLYDSITVWQTTFGSVTGLPEKEAGVCYIVSRLVLQACPERDDLLAPGEGVRDHTGIVVACEGLSR